MGISKLRPFWDYEEDENNDEEDLRNDDDDEDLRNDDDDEDLRDDDDGNFVYRNVAIASVMGRGDL